MTYDRKDNLNRASYMNIFDSVDPKVMRYARFAVGGLLGLMVLLFFVQLLGSTFRPLMSGLNGVTSSSGSSAGFAVAPSMAYPEMGVANEAAYDYAYDSDVKSAGVGLSARNMIAPGAPSPAGDAEEYEVKDYAVTIETAERERDCAAIAALKAREEVSFEYANEHDRGCNFSFKVKRAAAAAILELLKGMDPKDVSENTSTIKRLVDDFTAETDVLVRQRDSIDATLKNAIIAYDEITKVASGVRDAEALSRIIDSKIGTIERLTQQRIMIDQQIERLGRAKALEIDRVDYVFFNVNVYERKFADGEELADSWREAVRQFVRNANASLQYATIGLLALLLVGVQYALYALVLLLAVKYGWRVGKRIWRA